MCVFNFDTKSKYIASIETLMNENLYSILLKPKTKYLKKYKYL